MSINVFFSVFNRLKKGILRSILSFLEIFLSLKVYLSDLIVLHWSGSQIPIRLISQNLQWYHAHKYLLLLMVKTNE